MDQIRGKAREDALRRSGALDGAASLGLDKLARLARFVSGSSFAAIHLLGDTFQYRVAESGGLALTRDPIVDSMCLPVVESERRLYLPDATEHAEFENNPNTSGSTPVRFFAATPLRDDTGVTIGTLCVFDYSRRELDDERLQLLDDIAEHVQEHLELHGQVRQLSHSATHDALTGLPNRTLLSELLARAMRRRERQKGEPALAMLDLDGFKAINDAFGHQTGDEVLIQVGRRLTGAVRAEDTVARLGGDEFVVLYDQLPVSSVGQHPGALQRRLQDAFNEPLLVSGQPIPIHASVGLVHSRADEMGYELIGRADAAMYQQKQKRRAATGASED